MDSDLVVDLLDVVRVTDQYMLIYKLRPELLPLPGPVAHRQRSLVLLLDPAASPRGPEVCVHAVETVQKPPVAVPDDVLLLPISLLILSRCPVCQEVTINNVSSSVVLLSETMVSLNLSPGGNVVVSSVPTWVMFFFFFL